MKRIIVVSNRLPYSKDKDPKTKKVVWKKSSGGLVTALDPILRQRKGLWIGWDGEYREDVNAGLEKHDVSELGFQENQGSYEIISIPINKQEIDEYYNHFSNSTLWGLFHYFFEKTTIDYASWHTYQKINQRFAKYIAQVATPEDIIWVQDYQLLLCPYYLRQLKPNLKIHFFLHIPFPNIDVFSTLPWQQNILESLLCCNSIGFHHRRYLKNFMEVVSIYKKEKEEENKVSLEDSIKTVFFINPISIDFNKFDRKAREPQVQQKIKELVEHNEGKKIIVGVDRLDYSKGIKEKMLGIENLLETKPELKEKFVFYQIAVPSREDVEDYQDFKKEIDEILGRINGTYSSGSWHPIHYRYTSVPFDELVAMYASADIALITPLRDGMNLVCKEYVASHINNDGVLILSKFAGASVQIKNAIKVNPYSFENIATAIYKALMMPDYERKIKMRRMRRNIAQNDINKWLNRSLEVFKTH